MITYGFDDIEVLISMKKYPYYASGEVVQGFQRGSKDLGMPTANFAEEVVDELPVEYEQGVYYGWAQVENGNVYNVNH